jgi:hypothetical protein
MKGQTYMQKTINTQQSMIDLFTALGTLAEQDVDELDGQNPGAKAEIGVLIKNGAEMYAHIAMHPVPSVSLYLQKDGEEKLIFQMIPRINQRIN